MLHDFSPANEGENPPRDGEKQPHYGNAINPAVNKKPSTAAKGELPFSTLALCREKKRQSSKFWHRCVDAGQISSWRAKGLNTLAMNGLT